MDVLNFESVTELMNRTHEDSISIYMPTFRKGSEGGQNLIRYKNLIRSVEKQLQDKKWDTNKTDDFLYKAKQLLQDTDFWNHQLDGLAIFIAPGEFQYIKLPAAVEERIYFGSHYYFKPVLPLLNGEMLFYIIALDLKKTSLFKCTHYSITEIDLGKTIISFDDFIKFSETAPANTPQREASFHGHGSDIGESARKKDIVEFFRLIDKGIKTKIADSNKPLIAAGVEYLIPLYKEANTYSNLSEDVMNKNPQNYSLNELLKEGYGILEKQKEKKIEDALKIFGDLLSYEKASYDVEEVIKAAHSNKILHLFVNFDEELWGKFNPDKYEVELHRDKQAGDTDLLSAAVQQTIYHNGFVYPLKREKMPNHNPIAAVFRY